MPGAIFWGRMIEDAFDEGIWMLVLVEIRENGVDFGRLMYAAK